VSNLIADIGSDFFGGKNPIMGTDAKPLSGIGSLVSVFLKLSFVIAGLILLFYFILGGIGMISAAGKSDPKVAEQAKATITSAIIGFVVVFTAYWIVKLILTLLNIPNLI
jgi:hypothetical protein